MQIPKNLDIMQKESDLKPHQIDKKNKEWVIRWTLSSVDG